MVNLKYYYFYGLQNSIEGLTSNTAINLLRVSVPFYVTTIHQSIKAMKASKAQDAKNRAKLTSDKHKFLAGIKEEKGNFMMQDAPESKKGKRSVSRIGIPCPQLPGVPAVPSLRKPQPREVLCSLGTIAQAIVVGQLTDPLVPKPVMENKPLLVVVKDEKERNIHSSASSVVIQGPDQTLDPLKVDVELIDGLTPQSSTSRTASGSGMSTMSYENDFDIKLELTKPDVSGSEIDVDNNLVDFSLCQGNFSEYSAEFDHLDDPTHAEAIQRTGAEANVTFRGDLEDSDLLFFDWRGDINNFEGVREIFTGPSGPMFEVAGLTPLEVLKKIWDDDIIDHIVRETNRYANQMQVKAASKINSRMSRWRDTTGEEIWRFFTIIMLQSFVVNNVEREYWYPSNEQLKIGAFEKIMFFNRFLLLKRCLQFVDNTVLPENPSEFDKVMPVIKHLNQKFSTLYLPEQNVAIKESFLPWKGPLPFAQLIATKRAKVGVKSYELCESRTGYLWRMEVYSGKGHVHAPQEAPQEAIEGQKVENDPESATSEIVYTLMKPLFGKGHTIVMDNSCNAPLLSRLLKTKHKTDTMGSLRLNREFVPETLKCKNKDNMKVGEVCFSTTKDLSMVVWKDKNVVAMISTFHHPQVGGNEKYGYKYKPKVILDYNLSMGGVDHKDQTLHAFPLERVRNTCWYQKLFRRLLNVSVHNAMVIYNHDRTQKSQLGNRDFRLQLVREMLQMCSISGTNCSPTKPPKPPSPTPLSQLHLPAKNQKSQRCKLCYEAKVRRATVWRCSTCQVNLCIEGCYTAYHAKYVCK